MEENKIKEIEELLQSNDLSKVKTGLVKAEDFIGGGEYSDDLIEVLTSLFFIDVYEYPEWRESVEKAAGIIALTGTKSLTPLFHLLEKADAKAQFYFALTIGMIGIDGLDIVLQKLQSTESNFIKILLIFALGKIKNPEIKKVIPDLIIYLEDTDTEIRDTAARTLGKVFEVVKTNEISEEEVKLVFRKLMNLMKDSHSKIRSKALHSIGKMLEYGFLDNESVTEIEDIVLKVLGKDKEFNWDNAFIVRKEASLVLPLIKEYFKK